MFIRYEFCDRRLTGSDVRGDLPLLESDPQGDNGDQWRDGAIQVDSIIDPPGVDNLDEFPVRIQL